MGAAALHFIFHIFIFIFIVSWCLLNCRFGLPWSMPSFGMTDPAIASSKFGCCCPAHAREPPLPWPSLLFPNPSFSLLLLLLLAHPFSRSCLSLLVLCPPRPPPPPLSFPLHPNFLISLYVDACSPSSNLVPLPSTPCSLLSSYPYSLNGLAHVTEAVIMLADGHSCIIQL